MMDSYWPNEGNNGVKYRKISNKIENSVFSSKTDGAPHRLCVSKVGEGYLKKKKKLNLVDGVCFDT